MGDEPPQTLRLAVLLDLMKERNISPGDLVKATRLTRKGINNILNGTSQPRQDNLVLIAAALGVKWHTLLSGYDGPPEAAVPGGVAAKTSLAITIDMRADGLTEDQAIEALMKKLRGRIRNIDEVNITVVRDDDEN